MLLISKAPSSQSQKVLKEHEIDPLLAIMKTQFETAYAEHKTFLKNR